MPANPRRPAWTVPGRTATARLVLDARAQFEGTESEAFVRVGHADGRTYLDLGDPDWRVVEIDNDGWRVRAGCDLPVKFRRPAGMLALPEPVPGGSLDALKTVLNVGSAGAFMLIISWIVCALRTTGPYPVLALYGEQGLPRAPPRACCAGSSTRIGLLCGQSHAKCAMS